MELRGDFERTPGEGEGGSCARCGASRFGAAHRALQKHLDRVLATGAAADADAPPQILPWLIDAEHCGWCGHVGGHHAERGVGDPAARPPGGDGGCEGDGGGGGGNGGDSDGGGGGARGRQAAARPHNTRNTKRTRR